MKPRTRILTSIAAFIGTLAAPSLFGQTTLTWTNPTFNVDIRWSTNWTPNQVPNPTANDGATYGDELLFDGQTANDLQLSADQGLTAFSGGPWGVRWHLTSNQTKAVNIRALIPGPTAGTRMNSITIDEGAGAFSLGDATTLNCLDLLFGGNNPATHIWVNNSTNPVTIHPSVQHRMGGGGFHYFDVGGPGDWYFNNYWRNVNNAGSGFIKNGSGNLYWRGTNIPQARIGAVSAFGSPVVINEGKLFLLSSDLLVNQTININAGSLIYNAPEGAGTLGGTINGAGELVISNGNLTLSGNSTYTGDTRLAGGLTIVNRAENPGVSGPLGSTGFINFQGGALGYGPNTTYDYSARFAPFDGQQYKIDTGGLGVFFASDLGSTGASMTKQGAGTLTLTGTSSYSGATTVSGGRLIFQGQKTGTGAISVADGTALGIYATGVQVHPSSLSLGTAAGAVLEFNNVNGLVAPILADNLTSVGTLTINVNSGNFNVIGQVFPLLSWGSGSAPAVTLGILNGAAGTLSTNGNTIQLTITETPYVWTGNGGALWDLATGNTWIQSGVNKAFANHVLAVFDDSSTVTSLSISGVVLPRNTTFNNTLNNYTVANSLGNNIGGTNSLTKNGNGTLQLPGGANTYTGVTTINAGAVEVGVLSNGGVASDIGAAGSAAGNLVLNGGTLRYTGDGGSSDRLITVGTGGGTIEQAGTGVGALVLNNTGDVGFGGSGPRTLSLTGVDTNNNVFGAKINNPAGGVAGLFKSGAGKWILTGDNTYGGVTTIGAGILQIGNGAGTGAPGTGNIVNSGSLRFNRTNSLTVGGVISGTGGVQQNGTGTTILSANHTYSGGTVINAGTLQIGSGGSSGSLNGGTLIQNESLLIFNTSGSFDYQGGGLLAGAGNLIVRGGGTIRIYGANTYTGWTQIDANSTFQPTRGNAGSLPTSVVTNNGRLRFVAQDVRPAYSGNIYGSGAVQMGGNNNQGGSISLLGQNFYTGTTDIGSGEIVFGDGITPGSGRFNSNVRFVNNFDTGDDNQRTLTFNIFDDTTFTNNITANFNPAQNNQGRIIQRAGSLLTLTGNNTYGGTTTTEAGSIQVGNGGLTGNIGNGALTMNGISFIWNRAGTVTFPGSLNGVSPMYFYGSGTIRFTTANFTNYNGFMTVTNGTVEFANAPTDGTNYLNSSIELQTGGTLAVGLGQTKTLETSGGLIITKGTVVAYLNTSLAQSNTFYNALSGIAFTEGTLRVINAGPALKVGQKFTIFSQAIPNGQTMSVVSPGHTFVNNLDVDGSVTVASVQPAPVLTSWVTGTNLNFSWPSVWQGGVRLQSQTNTLAVGLSTNWAPVAGTESVNTFTTPINRANRTVFYRLSNP